MPDEKLTLGEYFRREREKKGLDLKEIEERTKIPAQTLIFLEENQIDMLPPRTFLRGFLRVICKEFHFDEEELLAHLDDTLAAHEAKNRQVKAPSYQAKPVMPMMLLIAAAALIVIALLIFSLKQCSREPQDEVGSSAPGRPHVWSCAGAMEHPFSTEHTGIT